MVTIDEFDGVNEIDIDNSASPLVEVQFLDALEGQSGGEGPVGEEEDDRQGGGREGVQLLVSQDFGELLPSYLPDYAHYYYSSRGRRRGKGSIELLKGKTGSLTVYCGIGEIWDFIVSCSLEEEAV